MTGIPENVAVAFRFAQGLWPHDPAAGSEATAITWSATLAEYSVDEICPVLEQQAREHAKMPPLATLVADLRAQRHRAARDRQPLLAPPVEATPTSRQQFLRESQRRADDYREQLIREVTRLEGSPSPERLAEIREWAYEVGPIEAAWLTKQGVPTEVTQPQRAGGDAVVPADARSMQLEADTPRPISELADDYAFRWLAADATEREAMRDEAGSFSQELREAVNEAVRRLKAGAQQEVPSVS